MNDVYLINNNEYDVHFLLDMKKSLERQNSYIVSLIEETSDYNNNYIQVLYFKQENTFLLKLQEHKLMNETIINDIDNKMLQLCNHEIETGLESSMIKISFCKNCQMNM